eukprot:tig00001160_g7340.t1
MRRAMRTRANSSLSLDFAQAFFFVHHARFRAKAGEEAMAKKNYYAVRKGHRTGIFTDWDECKAATTGYSEPSFRGFRTRVEAEEWLRGAPSPLCGNFARGACNDDIHCPDRHEMPPVAAAPTRQLQPAVARWSAPAHASGWGLPPRSSPHGRLSAPAALAIAGTSGPFGRDSRGLLPPPVLVAVPVESSSPARRGGLEEPRTAKRAPPAAAPSPQALHVKRARAGPPADAAIGEDDAVIFADGGCFKSAGPGPGGWAYALVLPASAPGTGAHEAALRARSGFDAATTNNRMELRAAIEGLTALPQGFRGRQAVVSLPSPARSRPDSAAGCTCTSRPTVRRPPSRPPRCPNAGAVVMKGLTEWVAAWKRKGWRTPTADGERPVASEHLWGELEAAAAPHAVSWRWLDPRGQPRAAGCELVDAMAAAAVAARAGEQRAKGASAALRLCRPAPAVPALAPSSFP